MQLTPRLSHAALVLLVAFGLWLGVRGVDFGSHWDEHRIIRSVAVSAQTGLLLPRWYNYPSVLYDVAMLTFAPDLIAGRDHIGQKPNPLPGEVRSPTFLLRLRAVMTTLSLAVAVWLYLLVLRWRDDPAAALLSAALVLSSFELAYHARWVASDALMMQLACLTALCLVCARQSPRRGRAWLLAAAASAGVTCGTKYPGGVLLLAVLGTAVWGQYERGGFRAAGGRAWLRTLREPLGLVGMFVLALVATTPGIVLEPFRFAVDVGYEVTHYQSGHYGYTVSPGLEHAGRLVAYLTLNALSPFWPIALGFSVCGVAGGVAGWRGNRSITLLLAAIPIVYLLYLSTQRVLIVRNALLIFPFLAAFAAVGATHLARAPSSPVLRRAIAALVVVAVGAGFVSLAEATASIEARRGVDHAAALAAFLEATPERRVRLSPQARRLLGGAVRTAPNVVEGEAPADLYVFWSEEYPDLPANRFGLYRAVSGAREINFDYYPSWAGDPRLVATSIPDAERHGLLR